MTTEISRQEDPMGVARALGLPTTPLPSTINQPKVERAIRRAFRGWWTTRKGKSRPAFNTFFKHGHWWISVCDHRAGGGGTDRTFDAVDAEGGDSIGGFSFEEV